MKINLSILLVFLTTSYVFGQKNEEIIIGKWEFSWIKPKLEEYLIGAPEPGEKEEVVIIEFMENNKGYDYDSNSYFEYCFITDEKLIIGSGTYKILKIKRDEIIMENVTSRTGFLNKCMLKRYEN